MIHIKKIAKFMKISYHQFEPDMQACFSNMLIRDIKNIYSKINVPRRATKGSAGYDFHSPIDFTLKAGETIKLPTGIRVKNKKGWFLACFPRSSHGFKYRLQLDNTVGIIDNDYFNGENEGHIFVKLTNDSREGKELTIKAGDAILQGIFIRFGITLDDDCIAQRTGGLGSTGK